MTRLSWLAADESGPYRPVFRGTFEPLVTCLCCTDENGFETLGFGLWWKSCVSLVGLSHRDHKKFHPEINKSHHFSRGERGHNVQDCITGWARHVTGSTAQWPAHSPAPNDRSEGSGTVSGSLGPPDSRYHRLKSDWCGYFLWSRWLRPSKLTHDFHHNPNPKVPEPFLPVPP